MPAPVTDAGLKLAVTPLGAPVAENETADLKPPTTAVETVTWPEPPCTTLTVADEAVREKPGAMVTVSVSLAVCTTLPEVAVRVMG